MLAGRVKRIVDYAASQLPLLANQVQTGGLAMRPRSDLTSPCGVCELAVMKENEGGFHGKRNQANNSQV